MVQRVCCHGNSTQGYKSKNWAHFISYNLLRWLRDMRHCPADRDRLYLCFNPLLPPHPSWERHLLGTSMLWDPHLL